MKVLVKCASRMHGIGKESKRPYDFAQLETMVKAEQISTANYTKIAFGMQDMKPLNLDPALLPFFEKIAHQLPMVLEVTLEPRPHQGEYVNTVVGVKHIPAVQAA